MKEIQTTIQNMQRHRLLLIDYIPTGIHFVDVGQLLCDSIKNRIGKKNLSLIAEDALNQIIRNHITCNPAIGEYLALENIGILFEPDLKFNLHNLFDQWAKSYVLIVHHKGIIKDHTFFLGTKPDTRYSISLSDITYRTLHHEI